MEISQPEVNEGWREVAVGAALFLTTVLPMTALSQKHTNPPLTTKKQIYA